MNANQKRILSEAEVKFYVAGLIPEDFLRCRVSSHDIELALSLIPDSELDLIRVEFRKHLRTGSLALGPHAPVKVCALLTRIREASNAPLGNAVVQRPKAADQTDVLWSFGYVFGGGNES